NNSNDSNITIAQDANTEEKSNDNEVEKIIKNADSNAEISNLPPKLKLPQTYEEIVKFIDKDLAKISELIIPVTQFEKEVNQVVNDIEYSGYLLFLYGLPGVGKSTFVSSLEWRKHIPIKTIFSIDTRKLSVDEPKLK
ncbi:MAG: ATP-binding protein, partial [Dolichospermum sp.]